MSRRKKVSLGCIGLITVLSASLFLLFLIGNWPDDPQLTPTTTPTPLSTATIANTPTRQVIASINLIDKQLEDGSIQTMAELSMAPLTLGTFDVVASQVMTVTQPSVVSLTIDPGTGLSELAQTPIETGVDTPGEADHLLSITEELEIYPVMTAELMGADEDFKIEDIDKATKPIIFGQLTTWKWQVTPKGSGDKLIFLQISIPVEVAGQIYENAQMLAQKELFIHVNALPTSTPTPTPSVSERLINEAQSNVFSLVVGLVILGFATAIIWWIMKQWRSSESISFDEPSPEGHTSEQLIQLLNLLDEKFNDEELQTLCFSMNIQYDNLPTRGKIFKTRELIAYCRRQERLGELINSAEEMRPGDEWAKVRAG